ncbi:MAG: hypothetical protein C5B50_04200 [Verrucomicrobia bacterium]|nr:MAG: hypothetical protein C5B50_04200 [Verrucomicrobiota bacterium]
MLLLGSALPGLGNSVLLRSEEHQIEKASAIFRGTVVAGKSYENAADGMIYTRTALRVDEVFKGKLPAVVTLIHRGGEIQANRNVQLQSRLKPGPQTKEGAGTVHPIESGTIQIRGEADDSSPQFKAGAEYLVFVSRRPDGTLFVANGEAGAREMGRSAPLPRDIRALTPSGPLPGADVTDQSATLSDQLWQPGPNPPTPRTVPASSATNLMVGGDGIPARFILPDRGEPIPYFIDADYLPAGLTLAQATNAVISALNAWLNPTSLRYKFAGLQSFGMAAPYITNGDCALRIQLHDHYNYIGSGAGSGDTLGVGGHAWTIANSPSGWTVGGNVAGNDFHKVVNGYIVIAHTNVFLQNVTNLAEVLCHEVGHTVGLAHSSNNASETNTFLQQAIMYCAAHGNGRGATLNGWDTNVIRQVHPATNTPPYCYDRVMDVVTDPNLAFTNAGVNTVQFRGYKLQSRPITIATNDASVDGIGTFSLTGSNLTFFPSGFFSGSGRVDPAGTAYYERIYARYSDGTNASPYALVRVVQLYTDSYYEGIPDLWRSAFFGNPNPSVGANHAALQDADGDGFSNLTEWWLGSNPTNSTSNLRITSFSPLTLQWPAKGCEVYEIHGSSNLINWVRILNPIIPTNCVPGTNAFNITNSTAITSGITNGGPYHFFRVQKVQ